MFKFAANLSDEHEYAIVYWGQSNARPWGLKATGRLEAPHLTLEAAGTDFSLLPLAATVLGSTRYTVGATSVLRVGEAPGTNAWVGAELRLGTIATPVVGFGVITANTTTSTATFGSTAYAAAALSFDHTTETITSVAHGRTTGDAVVFAGTLVPTDLTFGVVYYLIVLGVDTFQLATTMANALASTVKTFSGNGTAVTMATTIGFDNATESVFRRAHGLSTGDAVVLSAGTGSVTVPTDLAFATVYYAVYIDANTFRLATSRANAVVPTLKTFSANGAGIITAAATLAATVSVTWNADVTIVVGATDAWVWRDKWKTYDSVRILTPFLPEAPGDYPAGLPDVPGYTYPDTIVGYETAGAFLPFTFLEGIEGPGTTGTGHASTVPTASTYTGAAVISATDNLYAGGWIQVGGSVGKIKTHVGAVVTLTSAGWTGGTPAVALPYEVFVGHYDNSPHAVTPGYGFRYPNNDPMPSAFGTTGLIYNRPRGRLTHQYGDRFGAMLEFAWRLSLLLGKRINVIHLAINSAGQYLAGNSNAFGFQGTIGWWNDNEFLDWTPGNPTGSAARLRTLIQTIAPGAITAEGNTKTLKIIGIVGAQGEGDALQASVRATYKHTLPTFYSWLRNVIIEADLSAYEEGVKIPVVHQKIRHDPYELVGTFTQYPGFIFTGDDGKLVNSAIEDFAARDGLAATFEVDASPSMFTAGEGNLDPLHFSGKGEAMNGKTCAETMAPLIDLAASFGDTTGIVDICNLALAMLGEPADLTSLDQDSANAALCARFYPLARDTILEMHSWNFNTKRVELTEITNSSTQWTYAYAKPYDCLKALTVIHKDAASDNSATFPPDGSLLMPGDRNLVTGIRSALYSPQDFNLEIDAEGMPVIYTNQPEAMLRYNARISDATLYPPLVVQVIVCQLASMLAGPIIKGEAGSAAARRCLGEMAGYLSKATPSDSNQRQAKPMPTVPWQDAR